MIDEILFFGVNNTIAVFERTLLFKD